MDPALLCRVIDQSSALVALLREDGRIIYLNRPCARSLGGSLDELAGQDFFALRFPGQPERGKACFQAITRGPWPYREDESGAEGTRVRWLWSPAVLDAKTGRAWLGIATEASELPASPEDRLPQDLVQAFELTHLSCALLDRQFRFVYVNPAYADNCHRARQELLGRSHFQLFPNIENQAIFERVRDTGEPYVTSSKPFVFAHDPSRGVTWWNWSLVPLKGANGQTERLLLSLIEITDMVRAREQSAQLAAEFEAIFAAMTEGVLVYDATGMVVRANPAIREMFGFDPAGQHYTRMFPKVALRHANDHTMPAEQMPVARSLRTGETAHDRVMITREGGVRKLLVCSAPLRVGEKVTGVVAVWTDITEREQLLSAEQTLRAEAERTAAIQERFIAVLGHDLRSPLMTISLSATSLLQSGLDERGTSRVKRISAATERITTMIRDILDFARGRSGHFPVELQPTDLRQISLEAVEEVRAAHPNRQIELELSGDCTGSFDQQRVTQVVVNLLTNALVHGADAPVRLQVAGREDCVQLAVINQGEPIPEAKIPELFEPFRRAEPAPGRAQGLGLGLFIVREIVRAHGGKIEVHSSRDAGTTFAVCFPRVAPGNEQAPG